MIGPWVGGTSTAPVLLTDPVARAMNDQVRADFEAAIRGEHEGTRQGIGFAAGRAALPGSLLPGGTASASTGLGALLAGASSWQRGRSLRSLMSQGRLLLDPREAEALQEDLEREAIRRSLIESKVGGMVGLAAGGPIGGALGAAAPLAGPAATRPKFSTVGREFGLQQGAMAAAPLATAIAGPVGLYYGGKRLLHRLFS